MSACPTRAKSVSKCDETPSVQAPQRAPGAAPPAPAPAAHLRRPMPGDRASHPPARWQRWLASPVARQQDAGAATSVDATVAAARVSMCWSVPPRVAQVVGQNRQTRPDRDSRPGSRRDRLPLRREKPVHTFCIVRAGPPVPYRPTCDARSRRKRPESDLVLVELTRQHAAAPPHSIALTTVAGLPPARNAAQSGAPLVVSGRVNAAAGLCRVKFASAFAHWAEAPLAAPRRGRPIPTRAARVPARSTARGNSDSQSACRRASR